MKKSKLILATLTATIAIVGICTALPPETRTQPANASQATVLDHSQCQYPDRTTNSAGGCDNSDPCDPQDAVKGGSGECKAVYSPPTVQSPQASTTPDAPVKPNKCGGQ